MGPGATSCEDQLNLLMLSLEARSPWKDLMVLLGNQRENKTEKKREIVLEDKTQDNERLKGR